MTIDEFNKTAFGCGMIATYMGFDRPVVAVNFQESLLALDESGIDSSSEDWTWVRCENVELVKE